MNLQGTLVLFYIDEGSTLAAASKDRSRGLAPITHLATLVRATGISLWIGYHSPRNVSEILHSSYFMISTSLSNGSDIRTVQNAAFLTNEQAEAITRLPPGKAMMRMAGRYTTPMLIQYDRIPDDTPLSAVLVCITFGFGEEGEDQLHRKEDSKLVERFTPKEPSQLVQGHIQVPFGVYLHALVSCSKQSSLNCLTFLTNIRDSYRS